MVQINSTAGCTGTTNGTNCLVQQLDPCPVCVQFLNNLTMDQAVTCVGCGHLELAHTHRSGCTVCDCNRFPGNAPGAEQTVGEPAQDFWTDEPRDGNLGEVIDGRTSVYGEIIPAFTRQAQAISAVLDHEVQPWQVPLIMIAIKMIRTTEAPDYSDNSDDIEGYLDIFRKLIGDDMVHARSVTEYVAEIERRLAQS